MADVLFGDYAPTGKLAFTWPKSVEQIPINVGDAKYDPQFAVRLRPLLRRRAGDNAPRPDAR